jgi:hypothetical protein
MTPNNTRIASVARDPVTLTFVANWSDEEDRHEEAPEFDSIDDAIQWARVRAPVVIVVLGFSRPVVFSAGDRYEAGEDPESDPLPEWPPSQELLSTLLADTDVPMPDWGSTDVVITEETDE